MMIALLDTSEDLAICAQEIGMEVQQLITPLTRFANRGGMFAIDNGAFARFDPSSFKTLLSREYRNRGKCIFVAAPDIVGNARRTLELFDWWLPRLDGWPLALVIQEGQEDLPIPWELINAIFIGGQNRWKGSSAVKDIIKAAKSMSKWVHMGRVNGPERLRLVLDREVDSFDGTGISKYTCSRNKLRREMGQIQGELFNESNAA